MRFTPQGTPVTSFGIATNRTWLANGEKKEEVEFHNIVAWNKLGELCNSLLRKGRKVFIQGRLQTRNWDGTDGVKRSRTEIIAEDMVILDSRGAGDEGYDSGASTRDYSAPAPEEDTYPQAESGAATAADSITEDDIPF